MIDSHAHLFFDSFDADRDETIARAREAGVRAIVNVGIDAATSAAAVELARTYPGLFAAVGLHPTTVTPDSTAEVARLEAIARESPDLVVAVGETGLDWYWKDVARDEQRARLRLELDLARRLGLPVIFHCRDALEDLLSMLEAWALEARALEAEAGDAETSRGGAALPPGVFHCFSGGMEEARRALALGFHVSFAGNVTYPKAAGLQAVAGEIQAERLLVETDCPFLAPQPRRGKRNEPAFVRHTLEFVAGLRGVAPNELERVTDANAERLFGLRERVGRGG